ncbi:MAG TPA: ZIP family metal transporter [Cytophagaceae bacterium]|jgi:zinc transporter ZupT
MTSQLVTLFLTSFLAGTAVFVIPNFDQKRFKSVLSFSGAYLFSITVIHILPELFHEAVDIKLVGIYVLAGYFFQLILEYFSSGVEHGHMHFEQDQKTHIPYTIILSLCLHSFLEGTLLTHPSESHGAEDSSNILYGLVLHKIPEAFALMSVIVYRLGKKGFALGLLLFYACCSPLGLMMSNYLYNNNIVPKDIFTFIFALVAGNFLYISTTIFFESSPNHKFKARKLLVSLLGAALAVIVEYVL